MIDQTLGHYRVIGKIGAGGMGEVYRARDEQLDRDVALKVLPSGTLADQTVRKRFRQEALALAKLSHPNIATIFEFNSQNEIDFLVMELVEGTSLSQRLKDGPLADGETVRLGMQFAQGLAAAHEHGIIHRDIKPSNVMVTRDGWVKILDFGLAKVVLPEADADATGSLTKDADTISGTVPYMSPEQLRALPVDARSDIYAAGAVLYEMATGQRPFPQAQSAELIGAILHQTPPPARKVNALVSAGLENVIAKALEKDPSQRYQSARELRVALEGVTSTSSPVPQQRQGWPAKGRAVRVLGGAVLAIILLGGVLLGLNVGGVRERILARRSIPVAGASAPVSLVKARRSVAVVGFTNVSGRADEAWVSTALSEMLSTELAAGSQLRTIPGENVARMKMSLPLADAESYGQDTLQKIRLNLNADAVVVGSYVALGNGQIRLDVRLQDAVSGETLAALSEKGSESEIDNLVSRAGAELRSKLGAGAVTEADAAAVKAALPTNSEAARLYSQGLAKLRIGDALAARDLLEKAVNAEPNFALAHAALAGAWKTLGYDAKAAEEAKTAFERSSGLGREDQLAIEGRYREETKDWTKAADVYRRLWQFAPDNLEYGLRLASVQDSSGKFTDALDTLRQLRQLPPPLSDDPRIDLEETNADVNLSHWKEGLEVAGHAVAKARASGASLLLASAFERQGTFYRYLGKFDQSEGAFRDAQKIYSAAGNQFGLAHATSGLAIAAYHRGDLKESEALYEQALGTYQKVGSERDAATALANIAMDLYEEGNLARAKEMYQSALMVDREIGNRQGAASMQNSIANVLSDEGDHIGARKAYGEALTGFHEIGDKFDEAMTLGNLGTLLADEGNLREAKAKLEEALEIKRSLNNKHSEAYTDSNLGDLLLAEGDLPGARKLQEEALAIRTELGEKSTANENRFGLAQINLEEGKAADALTAAHQVADGFHADHRQDKEATAYDLAARCELALGKTSEAAVEMQKAEELSAKTDDKIIATALAITRSRILTATGDYPAARKKLDAALAAATKSGLMQEQLEARLALGELELKSGKVPAGRARLAALERDAAANSFLLIARKAHAASEAARKPS
jgi:tetratricopeptide (TPR) repeat protein